MDSIKLMDVLGGQQPAPCFGVNTLRLDQDDRLRHYRRFIGAQELNEPQYCAHKEGVHEEIKEGVRICQRATNVA
jgi:hypothetical protein